MVDLDQLLVIANPASGGGWVGRQWGRVVEQIVGVLGPVRIETTERPGHATELAKAAIWAGRTTIVSLGGDGTHSEVVQGILRLQPRPGTVSVGLVNTGTGGDFSKMLTTRGRVGKQCEALLTSEPREIDLGLLKYVDPDGEARQRYFLNEASVGMSGLVCRYVNESRKVLGGTMTYFVSTLRARAEFGPSTLRLTIDGQDIGEYDAHTIMVSNGQYAGGGMHFAPSARLDDGVLDVSVFKDRTLMEMVGVAPQLYGGRIADSPWVDTYRGVSIAVAHAGEPPFPVEADGEPIGVCPVEASVVVGGLRVIGVSPEALTSPTVPDR